MIKTPKFHSAKKGYYSTVTMGFVADGMMSVVATMINKDERIPPTQFKELCKSVYYTLKAAVDTDDELVMYAREDTPETVFLDDEFQILISA